MGQLGFHERTFGWGIGELFQCSSSLVFYLWGPGLVLYLRSRLSLLLGNRSTIGIAVVHFLLKDGSSFLGLSSWGSLHWRKPV